jgi:ADP-ribosylglycohydrolase
MDCERLTGGLIGLTVGDALGVPVEFVDRANVQLSPVTGMRGNRVHGQPPCTWSDDSSLALCTAESPAGRFDLEEMGGRFVAWYEDAYWTARGVLFDIV